MASKYDEMHNGWRCRTPEGSVGCSLWKGICKGEEYFFRHVRFKINNGESVRFWLDLWCDRECLANHFPICYDLAECKRGSVKEHMIRFMSFCSWNI